MSSFVGRRHEVAEVKRVLSSARLVTLTGVGGVGKTRLALRVAGQVQRAFPDGVWLVELAALQDWRLLERTVADAVGLRDQSARSLREVLAAHLRDMRVLLVLDNCEHLSERCAELVAQLLAAAPGLRVLATSRHAMRTHGERLLEVPPLPLPDPDHTPPGELVHNESIRLFTERATAAAAGVVPPDGDRVTIARICRRLDGVPLAIELAAAQLPVLAPEQILRRLDDRFRLLSRGNRAVLPRHRTLHAMIDWSYQLCSSPEQTLWARASVFAGGFDLAAVEAVCAGDGIAPEQVIDLVAGLVDKSVVVSENHAAGIRYRQLDTIAQYGRDELRAAGAETVLSRRHRDYYLALAERSATEWFGPTQAEVVARTRSEHANLRQALEFSLSTTGESQTGLRLAAALHFYWGGCGFVAEGRHWLDRALACDTEPSRARATALWSNAYLAVAQGNARAATAMAEECRDWAQLQGEGTTLAYAIFIQGAVARFTGDLSSARVLLEDALARFESLGELNSTVIIAYATLVGVAVFQGDLAQAVALGRRARDICATHGERWARSHALHALTHAEWARGELAQACRHAEEGLRGTRAVNDILGTVLFIEQLAWIAGTAGAGERAAVLLGAADRIWPLVGGEPLFGSPQFLAAQAACQQQARHTLGDRAFQTAFGRGADLALDEAIAYSLGENPEPATPAPGPADTQRAPLTHREQQVAELVAEGLSNKDIAGRLLIARRTAESHVDHILAKLGFTTRTQLATWVVEQRESPYP